MNYDIALLRKALVDTKTITAENFEAVSQDTGDLALIVSRILKNKLVQLPVLNDYVLQIYGVKYVDVAAKLIPPEILQKIPKDFSVEHNAIAFGYNGPKMQVAMLDPGDLYAIEYIRKKVGQELEIYLTDIQSIQDVIKGYKSDIHSLFSDVLKEDSRGSSSPASTEGDLKELAEGVPITKAVNSIIEFAVSEGTSDIHIEPLEDKVVIRFRIDGILHDMLILLKSIHPLLIARIKIMADLKIDEHRRPQDGRIKMSINDLPISLRVSIIPTYHGEKIVMRILDESSRDLSLKDIGFRGTELETIEQVMTRPDGMILVTGPTGSGKTTTLYTMMKILNKPDVNINTIEDPIEYGMPRINQTQVNASIDVTFANGLRALLRQDPDIIMVGEIRDEETATMAVQAALTGHLVLSTLHTNDAPSAIPRFLDMNIESFLLASTVNLMIAQRLVRKLDPDSRKKVKMDSASKKFIQQQLEELYIPKDQQKKWLEIDLYQAAPSAKSSSGYKGRVGIFEMFEMTDRVKEMVIDKSAVHELRKEMIAQGHMPMFVNGLQMVHEGITTLEEVIRVAQE